MTSINHHLSDVRKNDHSPYKIAMDIPKPLAQINKEHSKKPPLIKLNYTSPSPSPQKNASK
jgi:hypothetical protein